MIANIKGKEVVSKTVIANTMKSACLIKAFDEDF